MSTTTLLFAQNAIKAVRLTDECITIWHGDGSEPLHINSDDVMYAFHRKQFDDLTAQNLATLEAAAPTEDTGEGVGLHEVGPTLVK